MKTERSTFKLQIIYHFSSPIFPSTNEIKWSILRCPSTIHSEPTGSCSENMLVSVEQNKLFLFSSAGSRIFLYNDIIKYTKNCITMIGIEIIFLIIANIMIFNHKFQ